MSWLIDGVKRRVSNEEIGVSLVEGRGQDGDEEFSLLDASGNTVAHFFARSDFNNEEHNKSAPPGTNYSVVVTVFNIIGLKGKFSVSLNGVDKSIPDILLIIKEALSMAAAYYDLGFPKYVSVIFADEWLA